MIYDHRSRSAAVGDGLLSNAQSSRYFIADAREGNRCANRKSSIRSTRSLSISVWTIALSDGMATPDASIDGIASISSLVDIVSIIYTDYIERSVGI